MCLFCAIDCKSKQLVSSVGDVGGLSSQAIVLVTFEGKHLACDAGRQCQASVEKLGAGVPYRIRPWAPAIAATTLWELYRGNKEVEDDNNTHMGR